MHNWEAVFVRICNCKPK